MPPPYWHDILFQFGLSLMVEVGIVGVEDRDEKGDMWLDYNVNKHKHTRLLNHWCQVAKFSGFCSSFRNQIILLSSEKFFLQKLHFTPTNVYKW